MTWTTLLNECKLTNVWIYTKPCECNIFKVSIKKNPNSPLGTLLSNSCKVGIFDENGVNYETRILHFESFAHILVFDKLFFPQNRKLGFRLSSKTDSLLISLQGSKMPLFSDQNFVANSVNAAIVNPSTTKFTVSSSNPARRNATIRNNTNRTLYLDFGDSVSTSDYAIAVPQNGVYELPVSYTGVISGIVSGNANGLNGTVIVREWVC